MSILMRLAVAILALSFASPALAGSSTNCENLDACLALMAKSTPDESGWRTAMGAHDQDLVAKVRPYGAAAIPGLLKLLEAPKRHVRERAAYALFDIKGLSPADLPALEKATLAGVRWAPGALKNIDTPESIQFLIGRLRADPGGATNLVGSALVGLAPDSIPYLLDEFSCRGRADCPGAYWAAGSILQTMRTKAAPAVIPLGEIAADTTRPVDVRLAALSALKELGPTAAPAVPAIRKVRQETDPSLQAAANDALTVISEKDP